MLTVAIYHIYYVYYYYLLLTLVTIKLCFWTWFNTVSPRPSTWGAIWVFELRGGKFFWGTWGVIWLEGRFQKLRGDFRFWILILKIYILPTDQYFHSIIAKRVTIQYYYTILSIFGWNELPVETVTVDITWRESRQWLNRKTPTTQHDFGGLPWVKLIQSDVI